MGFSQGSRVAGGLLLDQQRRDALGIPKKTHIELLFGVLCNGAGAPMESDAADCMDPFLCFGVVCAYRVRYHEAG
jgi:hypothetical protein